MSSQASVKRAVANEPERLDGTTEDARKTLVERLQVWKQVVFAELLNLLERGRYDLRTLG